MTGRFVAFVLVLILAVGGSCRTLREDEGKYYEQSGYQEHQSEWGGFNGNDRNPYRHDSYEEVSYSSWGEQVGGSVFGAIFGFILLPVAFVLLYWNEGRAVRDHQSITEGRQRVKSASIEHIDTGNAGALLHVTGRCTVDELLVDPIFNVSAASAVKLRRVVEMFQWVEHTSSHSEQSGAGGKKTTKRYTYQREWRESLVSSADFKLAQEHPNPSSMPYISTTHVTQQFSLGAFQLSTEFLPSLSHFTPLALNRLALNDIAVQMRCQVASDQSLYFGASPHDPHVGDVRVRFQVVEAGPISIIAQQQDRTLKSYHTSVGGNLAILRPGVHSAEQLFSEEAASSATLTWVLRFVGWLLMLIGLVIVQEPVAVLADILPILGSLIRFGTVTIAGLLASLLSLLTISVAWLRFRPLLFVGIVAVCLVLRFVH